MCYKFVRFKRGKAMIIAPCTLSWSRWEDSLQYQGELLEVIHAIKKAILEARKENIRKVADGAPGADIDHVTVVIPLQDLLNQYISAETRAAFPGGGFVDDVLRACKSWDTTYSSDGTLRLHFGGLGYSL